MGVLKCNTYLTPSVAWYLSRAVLSLQMAVAPMQLAGLVHEGVDEALRYEQSALNSTQVSSFFRSLDDNCVWHLYHFDQVLSLFPGREVSRAKFRGPKLVVGGGGGKKHKTLLLNRFPNDKHLVLLLDGSADRAGGEGRAGGVRATDLAKRGQGMQMAGVRDCVEGNEKCLEVAYEKEKQQHVRGEFYLDTEPGDLPRHVCNYSAISTDLRACFPRDDAGEMRADGYAVALDFDLDLDSDVDQFLVTGGTGQMARDELGDWLGKRPLSAKQAVDEHGFKSASDFVPGIYEYEEMGPGGGPDVTHAVEALSRFCGPPHMREPEELVLLGEGVNKVIFCFGVSVHGNVCTLTRYGTFCVVLRSSGASHARGWQCDTATRMSCNSRIWRFTTAPWPSASS